MNKKYSFHFLVALISISFLNFSCDTLANFSKEHITTLMTYSAADKDSVQAEAIKKYGYDPNKKYHVISLFWGLVNFGDTYVLNTDPDEQLRVKHIHLVKTCDEDLLSILTAGVVNIMGVRFYSDENKFSSVFHADINHNFGGDPQIPNQKRSLTVLGLASIDGGLDTQAIPGNNYLLSYQINPTIAPQTGKHSILGNIDDTFFFCRLLPPVVFGLSFFLPLHNLNYLLLAPEVIAPYDESFKATTR